VTVERRTHKQTIKNRQTHKQTQTDQSIEGSQPFHKDFGHEGERLEDGGLQAVALVLGRDQQRAVGVGAPVQTRDHLVGRALDVGDGLGGRREERGGGEKRGGERRRREETRRE
jgi:hypothetical protein